MRYSMLVYITNMSKTLLEAAKYTATAEDNSLRQELIRNGRQMIAQIKSVLERHSLDMRTVRPLERLWTIEKCWGDPGRSLELEMQLEDQIRYLPEEVAYQVRAVFFAELGEKWDSMESVYEAMSDDPRFDPVVVLTPVYRIVDRGGNKVQETIYKDYLTPLGIPFLHYNDYSLEEDCPDLAFISQPYESCTLREFWPEHIAKYTRLVYLPYFLPTFIQKDSEEALCRMPVYRYAWKVIGSNQKHYQYYQEHSAHGGANMLLTGLPKLDGIVRAQEKNVAIPLSWKKLDGKRIFLWNTWYSIPLSSFRFFDTIVKWFDEHNDCALIWRPHPMSDVVTKLYYPDRYEHFQQCILQAKNSANIVLDEEVSFLAAFVCSDAQISDHSSMMQQYLLMDKPLLWFEIPALGATADTFIGTRWMERGTHEEDIINFLERIRCGKDPCAQLRASICHEDMPLADGHSGERVCDALWEAMHDEDLGDRF